MTEAMEYEDRKSMKSSELENWCASDQFDTIGWAAAFIWGAMVLFAESSGFVNDISWWEGWSVFFVGAGVITLAMSGIRFLATSASSKVVSGLIFGIFLIAIGVGDTITWLWPLILSAIGISILRDVLSEKK